MTRCNNPEMFALFAFKVRLLGMEVSRRDVIFTKNQAFRRFRPLKVFCSALELGISLLRPQTHLHYFLFFFILIDTTLTVSACMFTRIIM